MARRYKVEFEFEVEDFGFEGEEVYYMTTSSRYFDGYYSKEDFVQMLDMAGDDRTRVVSEQSVPMWVHNLSLKLGKIVLVLGGYKTIAGTNLFYWLMHKGLVDVMREPMCEEFDNKGYAYR